MSFKFKKWNSSDAGYFTSKIGSTRRHGGDSEKNKYLDSCPPSYNDLGKEARDLFNFGYYFGILALDITTRSANNVEIATSWMDNLNESRLYGTVEAKYHLSEYNLTLTEKLSKDYCLSTELLYKSNALNGLTIGLGGSFSPRKGLKMGPVKTEWSNRYISTNATFEVGKTFSSLTSSLVLAYSGLFAGFQCKYDISKSQNPGLDVTAGYSTEDFILNAYVNNGNECGGSLYHIASPELEVGIDTKWWTKGPEPLYGFAGRYQLAEDVFFRGKIYSNSELGFSYEQKLNQGITLTVSTFFDLGNVVHGKHQVGLALRMEL